MEHFQRRGIEILGVDVQPPGEIAPNQFETRDICDAGLVDLIAGFEPDTVIHGAFLLDPNADPKVAHHVNVEGTRNVLRSLASSGICRLMVVSSATVYGAWPDNPVPINERQPLRARPGFRYAADKVEVERLLSEFAEQHPGIAVSAVRPSVIGGPRMDNYLRRVLFDMPFLTRLDGFDSPVQLVHEADVVGAIAAILNADAQGAFNVAPADSVPLSRLGAETGRWVIPIPFHLSRLLHGLTKWMRWPIAETHKDFLYFARYPWVVTSERLTRDIGYRFRYTSEETMYAILQGLEKQPDSENQIPAARQ